MLVLLLRSRALRWRRLHVRKGWIEQRCWKIPGRRRAPFVCGINQLGMREIVDYLAQRMGIYFLVPSEFRLNVRVEVCTQGIPAMGTFLSMDHRANGGVVFRLSPLECFVTMDRQLSKNQPVHTALLVDDEEEICLLLRNMLRRMGITCDVAHSLKEGRKALGSGEYDAVFLDVNLPDGLGYDMIPDIKEVLPHARLIAISAMDNERARALEAGADIFVPKPFNREMLIASIGNLGFIS